MIYFLLDNVVGGGAFSLTVRIAKWCNKRIKAGICYKDIDEDCLSLLKENKIKSCKVVGNQIRTIIKKSDNDDVVFCYSFKEYLLWSVLYRKRIKCVLYVIHPKVFDIERLEKFDLIRKVVMKLCKNSINRGMENHEIVFMTKSGFEYIDSAGGCSKANAEIIVTPYCLFHPTPPVYSVFPHQGALRPLAVHHHFVQV